MNRIQEALDSIEDGEVGHAAQILREALAEQPAQVDPCIDGSCSCCWTNLDEQPAQQRYTTARNAWTGRATYKCNHCGREDFRSEHSAMFHLCKPAPEQSEQQQHAPVAWGKNQFIENDDGVPIGTDEPELAYGNTPPDDEGWWPLYTSPPASKPWVGLTDKEFKKIKASLSRQEGWDGDGWDLALKEAIEAKLREKNVGAA